MSRRGHPFCRAVRRLPTHGGRIVLLIAALAALSSACAKTRAETVLESPPLAMPEPPPRVLLPPEEPLASAPAVADVPVVATPPAASARPPARRPQPAANTGETRETATAQTPEPPTPPPAPEPPRELRSAPAAADAAAERQVRDLLTRAARDLGRTDYRRLTAEGRAQYDQSRRFADQAEQAVRERNFVFAETLADKAATLARALAGS